MLPKPEKIKKKIKSEESDVVNDIPPEEKIRKKRFLVALILLITIGLSFVFWTYHFFKNFSFPKFSFSTPKISVSEKSTPSFVLEKDINNILSSDKNKWSFYVKTDSFLWEKNSNELDLNITPENSESLFVKKLLPSGVDVKENIISSDNSFEVYSLITIPNKTIILIIKVSGNNLENAKKLIPSLAEKIYWDIVSF